MDGRAVMAVVRPCSVPLKEELACSTPKKGFVRMALRHFAGCCGLGAELEESGGEELQDVVHTLILGDRKVSGLNQVVKVCVVCSAGCT
jgi:hypothetical protein